MTDTNLNVGDFITDTGSIYKIIEVKDDHIFYEPIAKKDKIFSSSIPIKNLKKAGLRPVISKETAKKILHGLTGAVKANGYDFNSAKEEVYQNEPDKTVPILLYIHSNQNSLSKNDKDLSDVIMGSLCREISFVTHEKIDEVKALFDQRLSQIK